ncbi:MAG: hypothetical protein GTN62_05095 [Gemmatimonadales bacterium]|nr:hypothetical protein [Gemmatimonadales bacterium]NIN10830.1 hypothetical protein [Gemmatimonadales bacterium]NIN49473.1 hypothetical protein [Gemmatimonadales bacterium]NIP06937.1 hypothetical protein [Gemmatimonadales bacterium]NIR01613.1 hypothetical protein [Gemmatimonadales bacterium]
MQSTARETVSRRMVWASAAMVAVILIGIVLFFAFADRAEPLLPSAESPTTAVHE